VSLVAYVYNYADYVGEMLESVLAQSFEDFELCFLDDGSTDGTGDVVRACRDPRIRYFRQDNLGRARLDETFNRCAREARGELLAVVNGDDHLHPSKLATQVTLFDAHPALDVSFHDATFVDAAGVSRAGSFRPALPEAILHGGRLGPYFFRHNLIPNPTTMFRRDVWRRVGPQEFGWVHDYDFWLRAGVAGYRFHFLPEPLIRYRVHERSHSTSSVRAEKLVEEARTLRRARRAHYTIDALYPEIAACRDRARARACAHLELAVLFATGPDPLPDLAADELHAALRALPACELAEHNLGVVEAALGRGDGKERLERVARRTGAPLAAENAARARAGAGGLVLAQPDPREWELLALRLAPASLADVAAPATDYDRSAIDALVRLA
jgi:GT2 family glycosyltransferase